MGRPHIANRYCVVGPEHRAVQRVCLQPYPSLLQRIGDALRPATINVFFQRPGCRIGARWVAFFSSVCRFPRGAGAARVYV